MKVFGTCEICGKTVTDLTSRAYRVRGWEIVRQQGGANKITGKVREPERIAHGRCAEDDAKKERRGLRGQEGFDV